ncbi:serine/threonine-protein kinase [Actinoplanes lutulentus]|uniref:serine/threonine-protein kinase n=1 Tax=Actinoplanes lutulentus TaxID=1287878 RepID=UPI001605C72B|nr:serine/threonine-protein kinase [Actinoplanes lutulentus]MBB2946249.1 serine/threonine-protein kinase [Actinoplanes lutulentus]
MEEDRKLGDRYRLLNELGRGGMAVVWRALDEVLNRPVAVKVLAGRYADDDRFRARILHEARAAATLSHPNIAQIYDFGESDENGQPVPYVVMELINGPTLQQRVARGPIPPRTVFRICGEIAAALAVAHADGLVHRDIKLANVMVTPSGAKVVDFGIAAVVGPASPEDALLGTPAYLAPERLTGGAIEPASDMYALGVLLYRLLAGIAPWSVETTTQMLSAHVYLEPDPLPPVPGVPDAIADLVDRCLAKNPADRPDAAEVSALLGDAAEAATASKINIPGVREEQAAPQVPGVPVVPGSGAAFDGATMLREATVPVTRPSSTGAPAASGSAGVDAGGLSSVPQWWKRKKVLAGGGVAAVLIALAFLWPEAEGEPEAAPGAVVPPSASPSVTSASPGGRGVTRPAAPVIVLGRVPASVGSVGPAASGTLPSVPAPAPSGEVISPSPSPSESEPAPIEEPAPDGTRLESPGGTVLARCVEDGAELLDWEPNEGFAVDSVDSGPALTTAVVFKSERARYRMTVTCFGDRPSAVVLPL